MFISLPLFCMANDTGLGGHISDLGAAQAEGMTPKNQNPSRQQQAPQGNSNSFFGSFDFFKAHPKGVNGNK
jgi:hypothetical protein